MCIIVCVCACVRVSDCLLVSVPEVLGVRCVGVVDICLFISLCIRVKTSARINIRELAGA